MKNIFIKFTNIFKPLNKIKLKIVPFRSVAENFKGTLSYLLPENWIKHGKSYILFWCIASFTVTFLIWASLAEINQVVKATGTVRPDSKIHLVQAALDGPIEGIEISLGDKVKINDILFIIDHLSAKDLYNLSSIEVETRSRKVEILDELVKKGSDSEFRLLDERLALIEAQKRFDRTKQRLNFSYVRSPVSGSISKVVPANIGQIVKPGALLAEIVPENDLLKIEAAIQPKDIAYVKVGQKAKIAFTAFDMAIYGQVDGRVTKIAANTSTTEDGASYYPAIIEVDTLGMQENQGIIIQSGMLSDVSIIGEERTVLSYIMNPITKLSMRALQE